MAFPQNPTHRPQSVEVLCRRFGPERKEQKSIQKESRNTSTTGIERLEFAGVNAFEVNALWGYDRAF